MDRDPTEHVRTPSPGRPPPDRVERATRLLIAATVALIGFAVILVIASAANLRRDLVAPATSSPTASALADPRPGRDRGRDPNAGADRRRDGEPAPERADSRAVPIAVATEIRGLVPTAQA